MNSGDRAVNSGGVLRNSGDFGHHCHIWHQRAKSPELRRDARVGEARQSRLSARFWERMAEESGEATIEFVGVVLGLLVPLVYLILVFFQIQAGLYAAEAGAAASARILTEHPQTGTTAAELAVQLAASDQGLPVGGTAFSLVCETGDCPAAGSRGEVSVNVQVPLPVVGTLLDGLIPAEISLSSTHPIQWGEHGA